MHKSLAITITSILLLAMLITVTSLTPGTSPATAAPAAAPTPLTQAHSSTAPALSPVGFFNALAITADTRVCQEMPQWNVVDMQYVIDQGTVNTTTLKLQHSNNNVHFTDGDTLVSANAADANSLNQFRVFGRYTCVFADVANSNTITITAIGVAK